VVVVALVVPAATEHQTQSQEPQPHTPEVVVVDLTVDHTQPPEPVALVKVVTLALWLELRQLRTLALVEAVAVKEVAMAAMADQAS
jgi:hypothetical protein